MMSRGIKILVFVVGWIVGFLVGTSDCLSCECIEEEYPVCEEEPLHIVFVGDSITTGPYPSMVVDTLSAFGFGVEYDVFAESGDGVSVALESYYEAINGVEMCSRKRPRFPNYVVLFIGINDCFGYDPSYRGTIDHDTNYLALQINQMAERAFRLWVQPIIVLHHNWSEYAKKYAAYPSDAYACSVILNKKLREMDSRGELWDARLVDMWDYDSRDGMKGFTKDGLHLDYEGHEVLASMITENWYIKDRDRREEWECF